MKFKKTAFPLPWRVGRVILVHEAEEGELSLVVDDTELTSFVESPEAFLAVKEGNISFNTVNALRRGIFGRDRDYVDTKAHAVLRDELPDGKKCLGGAFFYTISVDGAMVVEFFGRSHGTGNLPHMEVSGFMEKFLGDGIISLKKLENERQEAELQDWLNGLS